MALTPTEEAQLRDLIAQQAALLTLATNEPTIISKLGATKVNLSQLTAASSLNDTDLILVRQGTADKSALGSQVFGTASQAEVDAGAIDTKKVTPLKLRFGFAASFATNGYIKFPSWLGGLVIQWGSFTQSDTGSAVNYNFTFPIPFPTAGLTHFVIAGNNNGAGGVSVSAEGISTTVASGFTHAPTASRLYKIFAIGH